MSTTEITASADSYMLDSSANTNFGSDTTFRIGHQLSPSLEIRRAILKFSLSSISTADTIISADLRLDLSTAPSVAIVAEVANVTGEGIGAGGWVEAEVTWNSAHFLQNWGSLGGDFDSVAKTLFTIPTTTGLIHVNVTDMVRLQRDTRGQSNFNILMRRSPEASPDEFGIFHSKEGSGQDPLLTIGHSEMSLRYRGRPPLERTTIGIGKGL